MTHEKFAVDGSIRALLVDVHSGKNSPRVTIYDPKGTRAFYCFYHFIKPNGAFV